ncbi:carboxypeptidase regulatory-like domain-containing protein [Geobacillus stearothermophilus]|nr:carboxypeptidase regulatory-like domain-containing protein [Geobacillus stearothermophilus]
MRKKLKMRWMNVLLSILIFIGTLAPSLAIVHAEDLNGTLVKVQDRDGTLLQNGAVYLFEKRNPHPWEANQPGAKASVQLIYQRQLKDGEAFIPNAYLLAGKEYQLFVNGTGKNGEYILYHYAFTPGTENELEFKANQLKKVSFNLSAYEYTDGIAAIQGVDDEGVSTSYPFPIQIGNGGSEIYVSSNAQFHVSAQLYDKQTDVGYLLSKTFALNDQSEQTIVLDGNLTEIKAPDGNFNKTAIIVSENWNSNYYASKYFVALDHLLGKQVNIGYYIEKNNLRYYFSKYVQLNSTESLQPAYDALLDGEIYIPDYLLQAGQKNAYAYVNYRTDDGFYLNYISTIEEAQNVDTNAIYFDIADENGQKQQVEASVTSNGVVYEEVNDSTKKRDVTYHLVDEQSNLLQSIDANIGEPIYFNMPEKPGKYFIKLHQQHFTNELFTLNLKDYEFTLGSADAAGTVGIEIPNGYRIIDKWDIRASLWSYRENESYVHWDEFYVDRITSDYRLSFKDIDLQQDKQYVLHLAIPLTDEQTGKRVLYYNQIPFTYEQLKGLVEAKGTIPFNKDAVKVRPDIGNVSATKNARITYYAKVNGKNEHFSFADYDQGGQFSELWTAPRTLTVNYTAFDGDHNAYSVYKDVTIEANSTSYSLADAFDNVKKVQVTKNNNAVQLKGFYVYKDFQNMYKSSELYREDEYFTTLFITPGEYRFNFHVLDKKEKETTWRYELESERLNVKDDLTLNYTGDFTSGKITNFYVNEDSDEYYINGQTDIQSGDLHLKRVFVYRELNSMPVFATIKVYDSANKVILKGDTDYLSWFYIRASLKLGDYKLVYELPTGPREQLKLEKEFTISTGLAKPELTVKKVENGLALSWNADSQADHYEIYIQENDGPFQLVEDNYKDNYYVYQNIKDKTLYRIKVVAVGKDGKRAESDVVQFTTSDFAATALTVKREQGYLKIGSDLEIELKGSYQDGYKAYAIVNFEKAGQQEAKISLTYNKDKDAYVGKFLIEENMTKVMAVKAYITDANEEEKTNELTENVNQGVGATVTGVVTRGTEKVSKGKVLLGSYEANIQEDGTFTIAGIAPGTYDVHVRYEGNTYYNLVKNVKLALGQQAKVDVQIPVYKDIKVQFVDQKGEIVTSNLSVEISGKENADFHRYGYVGKDGYFTTWEGSQTLKNVKAGSYNVKVYGSGLYETTEKEFTVNAETDYTKEPIRVEVTKKDVQSVDVTLTLKDKDGNIIKNEEAYIYLYNWDVQRESNYEQGYYSLYPVKYNENGQIEVNDVIVADNYQLYVYVPGYREVHQTVNISENNKDVTVELTEGTKVEGKIANYEKLANVNIYAYTNSSYAYASIKEDGTFTLSGLAENEEITYIVSALDRQEFKGTIPADKNNGDTIQVEDITLQPAKFIEGKVLDNNGKPLKHVYIYVYNKQNDQFAGWARTDKYGYFKVRGLAPGTYKVEAWKDGYPTVRQDVDVTDDNSPNISIILTEAKGSFAGEGNSLTASADVVSPGKTIEYKLNYKNNGNTEAKDVDLEITLPDNVELVEKSVLLNGESKTLTDGKITVPSVKAGESGTLTFKVQVKADAKEAVRVTAKINDGELLVATTNVLFVTLQAPEKTAAKEIKVYGNAKPNATVEVYAGDKRLAEVKAEGRWWFADVILPVKGQDKQTFDLYAKVKEGGETHKSDVVRVEYEPNIPQVKDVTVHAGWNGDVKLNPYTGVATFAVVEKTPLDTTVVFDQEVDEAFITFLGETYKMEKQADKKTFTFDGKRLGEWSSYGEQLLQLTFKKGDVTITLPLMEIIVLIDPSGYVFEGSMENRLEGVTAVVYEQKDGSWVPWNAALYGQVNPQVTDAEGRYGWDVIQGKWRVEFMKEGYEPYTSRIVVVPPAETQLNVPLVRATAPEVKSITPANGATNVDAKEITIEFDRLMDKQSIEQYVKVYKVGKDGQETLVEGTFSYDKVFNGYKEDVSKRDDSLLDGNGQSGWFIEDPDKKLVKKVVFTPKQAFEPGTMYKVVIPAKVKDEAGDDKDGVVDYAGKRLVADMVYTFTTKTASSGSVIIGPIGGVPAPPADQSLGKEVVDEKTGEKTLVVSEEKLLEQVKDQQEAVIPLAAKDSEKNVQTLSAQLTAQTVKKLIDGKRSLVITANGSMLTFTTDTLKDFVTGNAESVKVSVNAKDAANKQLPIVLKGQKIVSKLYDFAVTVQASGKTVKVESFHAPVQVAVEISKVTDTRKTAAYYLNEKANAWEYAGGKVKDGKFVFNAYHFSTYAVIENAKQFKDVTANMAWAKDEIEILAARTIIKGKTDDIFAPNANITRAQFAVLLARALQLPKQEYQGIFADVPKNLDGAALEIEAASRAGIVKGSNGKFRPYENITREQMAAMIVRAIEYKNAQLLDGLKKELPFADAQAIDAYAKDSVAYATALDIIKGRTINGKVFFAPKENATRAQAAVMLYRLLETLDEF